MVNGLKNAYLTHFSSLLSWFNCLLKRLIFSLCMWKMWMRFSIRIRIRIFRICAYSAYFAYFAYAWPTLIWNNRAKCGICFIGHLSDSPKHHHGSPCFQVGALGGFLLRKFGFFKFCMFPSCVVLHTVFRTVFVFALGPFLPM